MEEREVLRIRELHIDPNAICPLNSSLSIAMVYELLEPVPAATWELVYEADFTNKRQGIHIHTTVAGDLVPGVHSFAHAVDAVKTEGVKEKYLLQVGVLKLTLKGGNRTDNVASVNMVTQVSKDPASGVLLRNIMNPLE
jgi:hypothetical protein